MESIRIQKYLADMGVCSRRQAENLITQKKVKLNGEVITEMGIKIDPEKDQVEVYGKLIQNNPEKKYIYIALNKPVGYISSNSDRQGKTVINLLSADNYFGNNHPGRLPRVFPIGRLDKDSDGLVILTNDGELTNTITHPRYEHEKEYIISLHPKFKNTDKEKLESSFEVDGEKMSGLEIKNIINEKNNSILTVTLTEGKNRQLRRMFGSVGYHIDTLTRTRINKLKLKNLPLGKWTMIEKENII